MHRIPHLTLVSNLAENTAIQAPEEQKDPRLERPYLSAGGMQRRNKKTLRTSLYVARWAYDDNSIGPGPPVEVLISNLSTLTTASELGMHFRSYGEIDKLELKVDPASGASLGLCHIRYRAHKSNKMMAHECAKRAVKSGNGAKVGMNTMKVEFDRDGLICAKLMDRILAEKRKLQEEAQRKSMLLLRQQQEAQRDNRYRERDDERGRYARSPEPRAGARSPNRGRGPSPGYRRTSPPRDQKRPPSRPDGWVANALDCIQREPYIHIPSSAVPPEEKLIFHLKGKLRRFDWTNVLLDKSGFYLVFKEEREAERCYRMTRGSLLFNYELLMRLHLQGNPNIRSPVSGKSREAEKVPEVKKYRTVDVVAEVTESLMREMKIAVMKDVKRRIAAPALYDFLGTAKLTQPRLEEERSEANADSPKDGSQSTRTEPNDAAPIKRSKLPKPIPSFSTLAALPRFKKRVIPPPKPTLLKLEDVDKKPVRTDARPLHHLLNNYHSDVGSDDESSTMDVRPVSRGMSTADDESIATTPRLSLTVTGKRKRSGPGSSRLRDSPESSEDEGEPKVPIESPQAEVPVPKDDDLESIIDVPVPNTPEIEEIDEFLVSTVAPIADTKPKPKTSITTAKRRLRDLDFTSSEDDSEDGRVQKVKVKRAPSARAMLGEVHDVEDIVMTGMQEDVEPIPSKKNGRKKLLGSKLVKSIKLEIPVPLSSQKLVFTPTRYRPPKTGELPWAIPTPGGPQPTIVDDEKAILNLEGWQELVKDEEDLECLRIALEGNKKADIGTPAVWAYKQKELKANIERKNFLPSSYIF